MLKPVKASPGALRVLFLAEGDAEDSSASGSGTPTSVIAHLRNLGATVTSADVELYGPQKLAALLGTWSPARRRWVARYHLSPLPYGLRSRLAANATLASEADVTLQYGGSFGTGAVGRPSFLYCDSHTLLSKNEAHSWGAALSSRQLHDAVTCQRRVYAAAAGIFTFSEFVRQSFLREYGLKPERVITVHAGPNFDPSEIGSGAAGSTPRPPTILFVGREFERKGGPVLLAAFRSIRKRIPSARLIIVGPRELDLAEPGVEFIGHLRKSNPVEAAKLQECFAQADVFCLPTRHEPFGIVILEAMFHGLPVVATNIWAIPEMVLDGTTGFVVPRDDVPALADRLTQLLEEPNLARRLGDAGRARAHERFTWTAVAKIMLREMSAAIHKSGP